MSASAERTPRIPKVIAGICLGLLILLLLVFAAVNIYVRTTYATFYQDATREMPIPGTDDGFIVQDLDHLEDGTWLFSGYTSTGASPVYVLNPDGATAKVTLTRPNGSTYDGHGSGITSDEAHVFLTDDEGFLAFDLAAFEGATDGSIIQATGRRTLEFAPAFLNIEQDTLYLGDFYHPGAYETPDHHRFDTPAGDWNPAVMYAYPADATGSFGYADKAATVYSIPERIQGMCITDAGQIVLSQSYGAASSHLLVYDLRQMPVGSVVDDSQATTFQADGHEAPLFFLDTLCLEDDIEAPPMSEGIEWLEGRIYIPNESASDKYIFGKLFGANYVYGLTLP